MWNKIQNAEKKQGRAHEVLITKLGQIGRGYCSSNSVRDRWKTY